MARDKVTYDSYEQDVFDNPPKGPVGVHRGSRPLLSRVAPFVAVVVVAALCGVGAWYMVSGEYRNLQLPWSSSSTADAQKNAGDASKSSADADADADANQQDKDTTDSSDQGESSSEKAGSEDEAEGNPTPQPEATPVVNKATQVLVVNGTGVNGYAGQKADALQAAGYTGVTAANPSGVLPSATVVWYQNETDKATAQDVAAVLGIGAVQQVQWLASPITVVLLN